MWLLDTHKHECKNTSIWQGALIFFLNSALSIPFGLRKTGLEKWLEPEF